MMKKKAKKNDEKIDNIISLLTEAGGPLKLLDISKTFKIKSNTKEYEELREVLNTLQQQGLINKNSRRRYSIATDETNRKKKKKSKKIEKEYNQVVKEHTQIVKNYTQLEKEYNQVVKEYNLPDIFPTAVIKEAKDFTEPKDIIPTDRLNITDELVITIDPTTAKDFDDALSLKKLENGNYYLGIHIADVSYYVQPNTALDKEAFNRGNTVYLTDRVIPMLPEKLSNEICSLNPYKNRYTFSVMLEINDNLKIVNYLITPSVIRSCKRFTYDEVQEIIDANKTDSGLQPAVYDAKTIPSLRAIPMELRGNPEENTPPFANAKATPLKEGNKKNNSPLIEGWQIRKDLSGCLIDCHADKSARYDSNNHTCHAEFSSASPNKADTSLVLELHSLASKFRAERIKNGSINYDTKEVKYILNDNLFPVDVEIHKTTEATALVEEFMLLANKQVALHLKKLSKQYKTTLPFIYRIHDKPKDESIKMALEQLKGLGIKVKTIKNTSKLLNKILNQVKDTPENDVVNQILIRSMAKAVYSSENIGHFGLGFDDYTHFTSPIRRYSDLLVHRLLREYQDDIPATRRINKLHKELVYIAEHISNTERSAMEAERASTKLASVIYAKESVGDVFEGSVSGVQSYGIFVILDKIYVEGFINRRELPRDDYKYDEQKVRLVGRKKKNIYAFGTRVKVRIIRADINKRQVCLMIEEE